MAINPGCNTVVCPPVCVNNDVFVPVPVEVIHPIEIITRYHPVPVYRHVTQVICRNVPAPTPLPAVPGPVVASRRKRR